MSRRVKISYQGKEHEADYIDVNQSNERWNEYLLEDGTLLKLKPVTTDVAKLVGVYDGEGNPIYVIKSRIIVSAVVPDGLKQKAT